MTSHPFIPAAISGYASPAPGTTTTADTSAASFDIERPRWQASKQKQLFDIVLGAQRNGAADMSMRELQAAYERLHSKRIDMSSVSSCCNGLVTAGRLVRATGVRACLVTGRDILPLSVPAKQAGLV